MKSVIFLSFCPFVIYPPSSQCLFNSLLYFFCNRRIFPLLFPFILQSFPSNVWCDSASTFHFVEICLLHCTLEAVLQKKPKPFSIVPHMSRPFTFSDPAEIPRHKVCSGQLTGQIFSFLIFTMLSNYCSSCSVTHCPSALLQDNTEKTLRFPFVPYWPNSSFTAALHIFPLC